MGCASSALLNRDDDDYYTQIGSSGFGHHIVSLTSTTYGLLTLDSSPPLCTNKSNAIPTTTATLSPPNPPEVINSWELMAGLDTDSFRFTTPTPKSLLPRSKSRFALPAADKENSNPNSTPVAINRSPMSPIPRMKKEEFKEKQQQQSVEADTKFRAQENGVFIYTTTLRGVRKTFEACNAVRAAIQGLGVMVCERDVSMDRGFKEELRSLMITTMSNKNATNKETAIGFSTTLPQVFVKGKHIGGAEEVLRLQEEGGLNGLLEGLPRVPNGSVCDGCGGIRFLPCFNCYGSCKMVVVT